MRFRIAMLLLITCTASLSASSQKAAPADSILAKAYEKATRENKNVFLLFHASWCGWCHKMDTAMNDPKVKSYFTANYIIEHLVVYESDEQKHLENPGGTEILAKYNGNDQGIPYWIIFDKNGNWLADSKLRAEKGGMETGENTGCPASEKEVAHFVAVLKKTSSLTKEQLAIITARFRENEN